jgi:hypothetical protein
LLQVFALLLVVLAGSLPGLGLAGTARTEPCHCGMPAGTCPMRMPVRSPGPAPCGPAAPVSLVSAPCRLAQAPDARKEPSPFPQAVCVRAVRLLASGPSRLARPGPARPLTPAELSVFRI